MGQGSNPTFDSLSKLLNSSALPFFTGKAVIILTLTGG